MRALIIEDEINAVIRLRKYLLSAEPSLSVVDVLDSIETTVAWFKNNIPPDLIFMDIHLADGSCFEIFERINIDVPIIFTTAYDEYALQSFKYHSIDYILKPLKKPDLERALDKFRKLDMVKSDEANAMDVLLDKDKSLQRLLVKVGPNLTLLKMKDVAYFYSESKITFAVTNNGRRFPVDRSLEYLQSNLDTDKFFRINRQFIIQMEAISGMQSYSKGRVKVTLDPPVGRETIVSTERSPHFKKWLLS